MDDGAGLHAFSSNWCFFWAGVPPQFCLSLLVLPSGTVISFWCSFRPCFPNLVCVPELSSAPSSQLAQFAMPLLACACGLWWSLPWCLPFSLLLLLQIAFFSCCPLSSFLGCLACFQLPWTRLCTRPWQFLLVCWVASAFFCCVSCAALCLNFLLLFSALWLFLLLLMVAAACWQIFFLFCLLLCLLKLLCSVFVSGWRRCSLLLVAACLVFFVPVVLLGSPLAVILWVLSGSFSVCFVYSSLSVS